mmetsp:Transcript_30421/g.54488  ORF Transcript_30421/g.54488 Transcript_30421/m.54488 type:complete len:335 (+) Transcript_30421:1702-2706(+)
MRAGVLYVGRARRGGSTEKVRRELSNDPQGGGRQAVQYFPARHICAARVGPRRGGSAVHREPVSPGVPAAGPSALHAVPQVPAHQAAQGPMQGGEGALVYRAGCHSAGFRGHRRGAARRARGGGRVSGGSGARAAGAVLQCWHQLATENVAHSCHGRVSDVLCQRAGVRCLPAHSDGGAPGRSGGCQVGRHAHRRHVPPLRPAAGTEVGDIHDPSSRVCAQSEQLPPPHFSAGVRGGYGDGEQPFLSAILFGPRGGDGLRPRPQRPPPAHDPPPSLQGAHLLTAGRRQTGAPHHRHEFSHERRRPRRVGDGAAAERGLQTDTGKYGRQGRELGA